MFGIFSELTFLASWLFESVDFLEADHFSWYRYKAPGVVFIKLRISVNFTYGEFTSPISEANFAISYPPLENKFFMLLTKCTKQCEIGLTCKLTFKAHLHVSLIYD